MLEFFTAFTGVAIVILVLIPISHRIELLDHPDGQRKHHNGAVPLIGGIAIFSIVAVGGLAFIPDNKDLDFLLSACALLAMIGTLDDRYDLHAYLRLGVQALAGVLLVWGSNTILHSLGNLFGTGPVQLTWFAIPATILSTICLINAYNMIDGIDGLAGGISLVSCGALAVLMWGEGDSDAMTVLILMIGALSAYLIFNLQLIPGLTPKVFLGDAGSMVLGFIIAAFVIRYASGEHKVFEPTTALWVVALPLMDIFATTSRRVRHRRNPLGSDRTHIHHVLLHAGLSQRATLASLIALQVVLCAIGIAMEWAQAPHWLSAGLFVGIYAIYAYLLRHAFKTSKWLRSQLQ